MSKEKTYTITVAEYVDGGEIYEEKTYHGFSKITYSNREAYEGIAEGDEVIFLLHELNKIVEE